MKIVHCRNLGFDCDQEIRTESEEEVLRQATEHAHTVHGVQVTPEVAVQVQSHIRDLSDAELEQSVGGSQPATNSIVQGTSYSDLTKTTDVVN
jgi:predicted small metal-binding protein